MPFAHEYQAGMELPKAGDVVEGFIVESVSVSHVGVCPGRYEYPSEIVVQGLGSKEKVRRAFKDALDIHRTLFSEYGNPYQCSTGKVEVERLDKERFQVRFRGAGVRVHLRSELIRFMDHLGEAGQLAVPLTGPESASARREAIDCYLSRYQGAYPSPPPRGSS